MKRLAIAVLLAGLAQGIAAAPLTYHLDPTHSFARYDIEHLGFSIQSGTFPAVGGTLVFDAENHTGAVDVRIDTATIQTFNAQRDEHLRGEKFFNVAQYPAMTFKADRVVFDGDQLKQVMGTLTLLGVSKAVTLNVTHFKTGNNPMSNKPELGASATAWIKRSDFGMSYLTPMIADDVKIELSIEALQN